MATALCFLHRYTLQVSCVSAARACLLGDGWTHRFIIVVSDRLCYDSWSQSPFSGGIQQHNHLMLTCCEVLLFCRLLCEQLPLLRLPRTQQGAAGKSFISCLLLSIRCPQATASLLLVQPVERLQLW